MPRRLQRHRKAGWRKPDGAVIVDRTSRFGNPYKVADFGQQGAVDRFDYVLEDPMRESSIVVRNRMFRIKNSLGELRGQDLLCTCALGEPCHGDVLIEAANGPKAGSDD